MILKIKRYVKEQEWWIIDKIKKISVSNLRVRCGEEYNDSSDILILDKEVKLDTATCSGTDTTMCSGTDTTTCSGSNCGCEASKYTKPVYYLWLICRSDDGEEFTVMFDTIAYILNDEGKTIEKIVANYND